MENDRPTRTANDLIVNLCQIILTEKDIFDYNLAKQFILSLTEDEICILNSVFNKNEKQVNFLVRRETMLYIQKYQEKDFFESANTKEPFEFDNGNNYIEFRTYVTQQYQEVHPNADFGIINFIFDYIHDLSEHYRLFEKFYGIRTQAASDSILSELTSQVKIITQNAVDQHLEKAIYTVATRSANRAANISADKASQKASKIIKEQSEEAIKFTKDATQKSIDEAKMAVEEKMLYVTSKISETSVTILGIFSGIVLTVVGGLFYSSSVLDNINSANLYRLIVVSVLIGFVCFNLIALMFNFISKIGSIANNSTNPEQSKDDINSSVKKAITNNDANGSENNDESKQTSNDQKETAPSSIDDTPKLTSAEGKEASPNDPKKQNTTGNKFIASLSLMENFIVSKIKDHFFVFAVDAVLTLILIISLFMLPDSAVNPPQKSDSDVNFNANVVITDYNYGVNVPITQHGIITSNPNTTNSATSSIVVPDSTLGEN